MKVNVGLRLVGWLVGSLVLMMCGERYAGRG